MKISLSQFTISTSLLITILGLFVLLVFVCLKAEQIVDMQRGIIVELKQDTKDSQIQDIVQSIKSNVQFQQTNVQHISSQEALSTMSELYPDINSIDMSGVFKDLIMISYSSAEYPISNSEIREFFDNVTPVDQVIIDEGKTSSNNTLGRYKFLSAAVCLLLIIIIAYIVISHIRLALSQAADKIHVIYMAGANETFIKKPFIQRSLQTAITASTIGSIITFLIATILNSSLLIGSELSSLSVGLTITVIWIIGFSLILGTTYIIVNLYLSKFYNQFANT